MRRLGRPPTLAAGRVLAHALAVAIALGGFASPGPSHAQAPAKRAGTFAVPPAQAPRGAVWDSLQGLEQRQQWLASDSLATVLITKLERSRPTDSLAISHALLYIANASMKQRRHADGKGFAALERSIGIRERNVPAPDPLRTWAHAMGGTFYTEAGQPERALAHARAAVSGATATTPPDSSLLTMGWLGQGTALSGLGRLEEAVQANLAALAIRSAMDGPTSRMLVPSLSEVGLLYSRVGDFDQARALLRRAVSIAELDTFKRSDFLEGAVSRLSTVENRAGNIAESLELALRAWDLARRNSGETSVQATRMRTVIAYRLQSLGDEAGSAAHLREIIPNMVKGLGASHPQTLNARLALVGCLLALGDTASVAQELAQIRSGIAGQERLDNSNLTYGRGLTAQYLRMIGERAAARETLDVGIRQEWQRANPLGDRLAALYVPALDLADGAGDRDAVVRMAAELDRLNDSTAVRTTSEWTAVVAARAAAEARTGLRDRAWTGALAAEDLARTRLEYEIQALPDARALQLMQRLGAPGELLVALARPDREDEVTTAWDRLVRWRGLVRQEVARRRPPSFAGTDTVVLAAHARWAAAQRRLGQLIVSGAAHPADPETAGRFAQARQDADEAERAYVRSTRGAVTPREPATLARVLAALGPEQALVAFAVGSTGGGDSTIGAFVATGADRRPRWIALGSPADAADLAHAWAERLAEPPANANRARKEEEACRRLGNAVRARLWDPIASAVSGARHVLLVAEEPVREVVWLALPAASGKYLADGTTVIEMLGAERELIPESPADRGAAKPGLLAIGDPDFDHAANAEAASLPPLAALSTVGAPGAPGTLALGLGLRSRQWPCGGAERMTLAALPGSRPEVEQLTRDWPAEAGPAELLLGARAAEREVKRLAPASGSIHLATHGVVVEDACVTSGATGGAAAATRGIGGVTTVAPRPASTRPSARTTSASASAPAPAPASRARPWLGRQVWLALAGANLEPASSHDENDGLLTAEEVVTLDLRGADWVVLSACHSGVVSAWSREGVLGMRRAFHLAGARTVIASRWAVGDDSAREWMAPLYAARARGAGAAVGEACRTVLAARRASGRSTHPFYWAAFDASGR